ncbi:MAG: hypothetical protein ACI82A_002636 [Candidatus Azotimanducaceae bacterium]|jgi:hypothetical protein
MTLRPSNPPSITFDQLRPGDILLSCGDDLLDRAIMAIDQTDYSHATEFLGYDLANKAYMVVEATTKGIDLNPTSIDTDVQTLVDAYRFVSDDGHRFGDDGWPADPVCDAAKSYVGGNYAYDKLFMLGVVIAASEFAEDEAVKMLIRLGGGMLASQIAAWISKNSDKTPMTCVEVICSAHWQAQGSPLHQYEIKIDIPGTRKPLPIADTTAEASKSSDLLAQYAEIRKSVLDAFAEVQFSRPGKSAAISDRIPAGSSLLPAGSVSLRDMQTSSNLEFLGCIQDKR